MWFRVRDRQHAGGAAVDIRLILDAPKQFVTQLGEPLTGTIRWESDRSYPPLFQIGLHWRTEGWGKRDTGYGPSCAIEAAEPTGSARFSIDVPDNIASFTGQLVQLLWTLYAFERYSRVEIEQPIVIGPEGRAIQLGTGPSP